jgi:hypothetical protein
LFHGVRENLGGKQGKDILVVPLEPAPGDRLLFEEGMLKPCDVSVCRGEACSGSLVDWNR